MPEPTVSAVIPVYNGERFLGEAIESALAQTRPCAEVIVVDNGSTDGSGEFARGFGDPVRVHPEPRRGIGFARNAGLAAASGDYVGFLDSDDVWEPRKNEWQLAAFEREPDLDVVFGYVRQFAGPELDPSIAERIRIEEEGQPGLNLGAMLAPRALFDRVGRWEEAWQVADGLAWLLRARSLGIREAMLEDVVMRRRIHGANQSFGNHAHRGEWARLLKESLDERRGRGGGRPGP